MTFEAVLLRQLATLKEELTAAAGADAVVLTAEIAELTAARDRFRARAEELTAANEALSLELEACAAERQAATDAMAAVAVERERAAEAVSLERERAAQATARERDRAAQADAAREREAAARATAETELAALRQQVADSRERFEAETARVTADAAAARNAASVELARLQEEAARAKGATSARLAQHLAALFEEIGNSSSTDAVLSAAANGLTDAFSRVALFVAGDGRLEPRYHRGFAPDSGLEHVCPEIGDASLLGRAAASPDLLVHAGAAGSELPVAGSASLVITAPIRVGGGLLAVLYADDDGRQAEPDAAATAARTADIVRRHAALRLERLVVELKTGNELRSYAKMLLDEIEYVYRADLGAKKPDAERQQRLTENVRCARQVYDQRVAVEAPEMGHLLEEVLAAAITAKAATPFGRELATVART